MYAIYWKMVESTELIYSSFNDMKERSKRLEYSSRVWIS